MHFSTDLALEKKYPIPENRPFYPADVSAIDDLLKEIQREYLEKAPYYQEKIRLLTESLILLISRSLNHPAPCSPQDATLLQTFQALRLEMLESCQEDWSIDRLLARCSMGKSQFYRYYRLFFHTTPKAELMAARMDKARILLTNRALQVQQVAPAVRLPLHPAFHQIFPPAVRLLPRPVPAQGEAALTGRHLLWGNSSAFRLHCHKSMHTGCVSRSLAPRRPRIPLQKQHDTSRDSGRLNCNAFGSP